jgi:type VI secretion system secreted protein VgrG
MQINTGLTGLNTASSTKSLESRVAQLESLLNVINNTVTLQMGSSKIIISSNKIELISSGQITIQSSQNLQFKCGANMEMQAGSSIQQRASGSLTIEASGNLVLKGAKILQN